MAHCAPTEDNAKKIQADIEDKNETSTIRTQAERPRPTRVISVKKQSLNRKGYKDLQHWLTDPDNIYIGRNMTRYVPGAVGSKWKNPFPAKKHGRDKCIDLYRDYIMNDAKLYDGKTLLDSIEELRSKTLGCWCNPEPCHGDVLVQMLMRLKKK
ncbi:Hypothetical predicted protein [Mytilus galloprovincialis]|uniref:DUF4326 domain-containing protein n=1 Tax=Mytilus galloprovincialis TaxID=29158 RepID=A0A8B6DKG8_MYTGA|nr:Hypothetical predicted protein [Mytilus galloprovincialis]